MSYFLLLQSEPLFSVFDFSILSGLSTQALCSARGRVYRFARSLNSRSRAVARTPVGTPELVSGGVESRFCSFTIATTRSVISKIFKKSHIQKIDQA